MSKAQHELQILVTGAAGRIGSVGRSVTELLLARGFRVRAQVRWTTSGPQGCARSVQKSWLAIY